ncbi:hypothetical protein M0813_08089 [Anaeramoeba flamelloides]|uniref:ADF-H domain-containing protein n=1 Tax=Anaeramoeba flamelloides TaxID=1746091 RepID=A0AAV7ZYS5_9EUKA|nr:hypothetical protein M0812_08808 [Anaeramoeba flamelloides]KAJ6229172.1 hypothetical protein M0813_08089 [Anaeramoeba flamelloides]
MFGRTTDTKYEFETLNADCKLSQDFIEKFDEFKKSKKLNSAMILKINPKKKTLDVEQCLEDVTVEDIANSLGLWPRFILYQYKWEHVNEKAPCITTRFSIPIVMIFYIPQTGKIQLNILYTSTKTPLINFVGTSKVYDITNTESMTTNWLNSNLMKL